MKSNIHEKRSALSDIFLRRREEMRLTQADVAKLSETSRHTVAAIEKGDVGRSAHNLMAIAEALQLDIVFVKRPIVHVSVPDGAEE